jgi:Mg-chelatase subunit ChlD
MTDPQRALIAVLLDGSGSMEAGDQRAAARGDR